MKVARPSLVEEHQLETRFEDLRQVLLAGAYVECLDHSLAFWTLPNDRRLPLAFLGRSLRDLLAMPFGALRATPGIGHKKMRSFVRLLGRVAATSPADLPRLAAKTAGIRLAAPHGNGQPPADVDLATVSELTWAQWRATVVEHDLTHEPLGRLAPTLRSMTRVVWNVPLGAYVRSSLTDIRQMKTHGEKRLQAIVAVFREIHTVLSHVGEQKRLTIRLMPRRIAAVGDWVEHWLAAKDLPDETEIRQSYIEPLLEQIRSDATEQIGLLAEYRLGIGGPIVSVRQAARLMGLTRARVYQLLNEISDIIEVRWPAGRRLSLELGQRFSTVRGSLSDFRAALDLFFPCERGRTNGIHAAHADLA